MISSLLLAALASQVLPNPDHLAEWQAIADAGIVASDTEFFIEFASALTTDPSGMIYVSDYTGSQVLRFDKNGNFTKKLGGRGEGPGEFARPGRLGWRGDTLWIHDESLLRLSLYADGQLVETVPTRSTGLSRPASVLAILGDGSLVVTPIGGVDPTNPWAPIPVVRVARDGSGSDTLATLQGGAAKLVLHDVAGPGTRMFINSPLAEADLLEASSDGSLIVKIASRPEEGEVDVDRYDVDNGWLTTTYSVRTVRLSADLVDSYVDKIVSRFERDAPSSMLARVDLEQYSEAIRRAVSTRSYFPPVSDLVVGTEGEVWLAREELPGATVRWDMLDARGVPQGSVLLPAEAEVLAAGGNSLWTQQSDDLGAAFFVRYRIEALEAAAGAAERE